MATLIDQRILIPAPTNAVWGVLADQYLLPKWRLDCQSISILTTRQFGVGMRRRCSPAQGKDRVEEITAWYEGLGYEYRLIDSRKYRSWVGRLRLQATPEGTVVQWTIAYEPSGMINSLRHIMGGRGQIETESAESLRQLLRLVENLGHRVSGNTGAFKRQSQTLKPVEKIVRSASQPFIVPPELLAADTKPRRPAGLDEAIAEPAAVPAPAPPITPPPQPQIMLSPDETLPKPLDVYPRLQEKTTPRSTTPAVDLPPGMPESIKATPPKGMPKVDVSRLRYADEIEPNEQPIEIPAQEPAPDVITHHLRPGLPPPTDSRDTGQISIWEAFGMRAPSQADTEALNEVVKRATGEHKAIKIEEALKESDTRTFSPLLDFSFSVMRVRPAHDKEGLRSKQARSHAKVRANK